MKRATTFLLDHSLFIHYLTLVIFLMGSFAFFHMRREARPSVNFDRISVFVAYNGASATDVEELVLKPIEDEIEGIDGIEEYRSSAFEGIGQMSIKIDPDYPQKKDVIDEVQRAVSQASLPADVLDPVVNEIKASKITVYSFALMGNVDPLTLRNEAKKLEDELKNIEGVSQVDLNGLNKLEYRIEVLPKTLDDKILTLSEIMASLRNWNKVSPAGEVDSGEKNYPIRIDERLETAEDIENLTVRSNDAGIGLKIKDVASVKLQSKELKQEFLVNGKRAIALSVIKNESADIVSVVERVKTFLQDYKFSSSVEIATYYDDSIRIKNSLRSVFFNAMLGLVLVLVSLMLFVSTRLAFVTAIGMPVAFLGGVAVLYTMGMTLNSLVVLGMIVVLGMLVDDAIVVAENIYSHVERGLSPREAAVRGVSEVAAPVFATVLTTVFAFLPVAYMEGIMGQFLKVIPITVIVILLFSLFEALIILPSHAADFLKKKEEVVIEEKGVLKFIKKKYLSFLDWSLSSRLSKSLLLVVFLLFGGTTFFVAKNFVKFEMFPRAGIEFLTINSEFPVNTSKDKSKDLLEKMYVSLSESEVSEEIFSMSANIGQASKGGVSGSREQGSHLAQTVLRLTDDPTFVYREKDVVKKIKEIVNKTAEGARAKISISVPRMGPPIESDIQILVSSRDFSKSEKVVEEIVEELNNIEGAINIQSDLMNTIDYYRVKIDKALAAESGFQFSEISSAIFSAFYGIAATKTRIGDDEVDIVVSLDKKSRDSIEKLENLKFLNANRVLVPLRSFATIQKEKALPSVQRQDGKRAVSIFGDVDQKVSSNAEANKKLMAKLPEIRKKYPSVSIEVGGSESQRMETLKETGTLFLFSLVGIFIVISLSFNSLFFPFLVMFAIPFGLMGVVWALFLHNTPLSVMGLVGVVGLSGVVVNGSIILIQFLLEELRQQIPLKEAILIAAQRRFRPIVITSITTLLGLAPTIYSAGGKDPFIQPLALSLGWGLMVSTLLTLFVLPVLIYIFSCKFYK